MISIPEKLAAIFQSEHAEHLSQIRSLLALLESVPDVQGRGELDEVFRRAHSLKGAARAVDLTAVESLAQRLETMFSRVRQGALPLDTKTVRVIHQVLDASEDCLAEFRENRIPVEPAAALQAMDELLGDAADATEAGPRPAAVDKPQPMVTRHTELVRVAGVDLDRLVRSTGQILTASQSQASVTAELAALHSQIRELQSECIRFRKAHATALRRYAGMAELAPLARQAELVEQSVNSLAGQARRVRIVQQRSAWSLKGCAERIQKDVWDTRIAPVEDLFDGFGKMVRDLARDEHKEIEFRLNGASVRADRLVLQALKDPLMHLLRNAISHGIEKPAERTGKGKPAAGSLTVNVASQRGRLVIEVDDDGRGVDFSRVAEVAAGQGLMPEHADSVSHDTLCRFLFRPGFSTRTTVTRLSGRGMGLSVVHETVRRLQGEVELQTKPGPGVSVLLSVPLSVSIFHLLMVECQGHTYGIASHGIERLYRIDAREVEILEGRPVVNLDGRRIELFGLADLLRTGDTATVLTAGLLPIMLLRSGGRSVAVWVDRFAGERESLIQDLGMPYPATGNISGGVLTKEGVVSLVLNPAGLVETSRHAPAPVVKPMQPAAKTATAKILVVDDSITTRSLEKSILEAHGYTVRVAVDGVEALHSLRAEPADLVIADIEMPRLDGFGLLAAMKADPELERIPVIIVSSLDRPEHQQRGLSLGADAYVVKRKFDQQELLEAVRQFL